MRLWHLSHCSSFLQFRKLRESETNGLRSLRLHRFLCLNLWFLTTNNLKRYPFEIQHPKFETSRLGLMRDNGRCDIPQPPSPGLSENLFPITIVELDSPAGQENWKIATLYRCFTAASRHKNSCCDLWIIWKEILWEHSIQSLKTADSVWLSLFMRDNGSLGRPFEFSLVCQLKLRWGTFLQ